MEIEVGGGRVGRKRKRSSVRIFPGRKKRRLLTTVRRRPLAPRRTGGFYGLNQGAHGVEIKDNDVDIATMPFNTSGAIQLLNGIAQGTDFTQRVGRKFTMTSIYIRMIIQNGTTQVPNNIARWMVVYDKQTNSNALTIANVLAAVSTTAPNNLDNRDRFVVIYDKCHNIGATGGNDNQKVFIRKFRRCNLEVTNSGTGNTVGSIATGSLYFITVGDVVPGTTASTVTAGTVRIRFKED